MKVGGKHRRKKKVPERKDGRKEGSQGRNEESKEERKKR